jgi:transmembrane sensor
MFDRPHIPDIILRILTFESSEKDIKELQLWIEKQPENRAKFNAIRTYWYENLQEKSHDKMLSNIKSRIQEDQFRMNPILKPRHKISLYLTRALKVAASVLLLGLFGYLFNLDGETDSIKDDGIQELVTKKNPYGQKSTIFLSDGSIIYLNSGSSVNYLKGFQNDKREIQLTGEAYFEVAEDADRPFTVIAHGIATTALGTVFNIRAYSNNAITVSLAEGKVQVEFQNEDDEIQDQYLVAGEQVAYNREAKTVKRGSFNPKTNGWKDGILYFENASEKEVFEALELWYGFNFLIREPIKKEWRINASYDNQNLESILKSLGYIQGFDFKIQDKEVLITNKLK